MEHGVFAQVSRWNNKNEKGHRIVDILLFLRWVRFAIQQQIYKGNISLLWQACVGGLIWLTTDACASRNNDKDQHLLGERLTEHCLDVCLISSLSACILFTFGNSNALVVIQNLLNICFVWKRTWIWMILPCVVDKVVELFYLFPPPIYLL